MKSKILFLVVLIFHSLSIVAQQGRNIVGTIKDNLNRPISNASIIIKGSNVGTVSDGGGNFEIRISSATSTLIFSAVGYEDQEVNVGSRNQLNIILEEKNMGIDEVVVMGYSSVDRQHVASSVAQMDMNTVKTRPIMKMEQAFSCTIPGVTMLQGNSLPGSVPGSIDIRGVSTLQNAAPLVIVDGMEQSLTDIDPNQIKSLTVLKDAACNLDSFFYLELTKALILSPDLRRSCCIFMPQL